jgi:hypothetical protein
MNRTYWIIMAVMAVILAIEYYVFFTNPYRVFLEPYENIPTLKPETLKDFKKQHSFLLLHAGKINLDIKTFSENVKDYAKRHKLDYYNASQASDIHLWQTLTALFQKHGYEYIWVVPTNVYIQNKDRNIQKLIDQSGDTDLILCRSDADPRNINLDTFIVRNSEWTLYKLQQFYYKQQPLQPQTQPQDDIIPLTTDIVLDQVYTKYLHKTYPEFQEYLDVGIPYMLMNICVFNEHAMLSGRSDFMRYYDRMPSQKSDAVKMYPWVDIKHPKFSVIGRTDNRNIISNRGDRKIPKIIFQTMESNLTLLNIKSCISQIKTLNPDYKYYYFTSRDCREFIKKEFPDVLEHYDVLLPGAYKADLWRYCVLYKYGGFYMDIRMYPYMGFDSIITKNTEFVSCIDVTQNMLYQAILGAAPGNKAIRLAIDKCVQNIRERSVATSDLAVTGPGVMGSALNKSMGRPEEKDLTDIRDERVVLLQWNSLKAPKYLQDDKDIFCCHKYTKLLLDSEVHEETNYWLMLTGKEHYSILYRNHKLYKDSLFTTQAPKTDGSGESII